MPDILVTGAQGVLGAMVATRCRAAGMMVATPTSQEFDLSATGEIEARLTDYRPDIVVNCAVKKRFDSAGDVASAKAVNALGPNMLAQAAARSGAHLIQISTDAVFAASGSGPFDEKAVPQPRSAYEISKHDGEADGALVLRASFVGPGRAAWPSLMQRLAAGEEIGAGCAELWNGMTSLELADLVVAYVTQGKRICGVRHVHGPTIDRFTLISTMIDSFGFSGSVRENGSAKDLRLASLFRDIQPAPIAGALDDRLDRLKPYIATL